MKVNLHTHTTLCYHALGTDEEYVQAAIRAGFDVLGFSDHTPFPYENGYFNGDKMEMDQLEDYISSVEHLREKYRGQIQIFLGLECESIPRFFPFLRELRSRLDYMILGNHGDKEFEGFFGHLSTPKQLWHYLESAIWGMETGLFLYLAHPDLMLCDYPVFDADAREVSRALCREASRVGLPLEYNLLGIAKGPRGNLGYPCREFWEIAAQENVRAVIGVDAHSPQQLLDADMDLARKNLEQLGITLLDNPLDV